MALDPIRQTILEALHLEMARQRAVTSPSKRSVYFSPDYVIRERHAAADKLWALRCAIRDAEAKA